MPNHAPDKIYYVLENVMQIATAPGILEDCELCM